MTNDPTIPDLEEIERVARLVNPTAFQPHRQNLGATLGPAVKGEQREAMKLAATIHALYVTRIRELEAGLEPLPLEPPNERETLQSLEDVMLETTPKFTPGTRVYILALDETKTVEWAYAYKGAEWAYVLVDADGARDEGWREDELERR